MTVASREQLRLDMALAFEEAASFVESGEKDRAREILLRSFLRDHVDEVMAALEREGGVV